MHQIFNVRRTLKTSKPTYPRLDLVTPQPLFKSEKKFILSAALIALLAIAGAGYYVSLYSHQRMLQQYISRESVNIDAWEIILSSKIDSLRSDLLIVANLTEIPGALAGHPISLKALTHEFQVISQSRKYYDQIRLLDHKGYEIVRINFDGQRAVVVPGYKLQPKGQRYYFRDTVTLEPGKIYISPLDLNIENGKLERPLKPMIRLATPIYDEKQAISGVVVLNYLAEELLTPFKNASVPESVKLMTNHNGYWLVGPSAETEWGFMFKNMQSETIAVKWPTEWSLIRNGHSGQHLSSKGLFTYTTLSPLRKGDISSSGSISAFAPSKKELSPSDYFWKIISHIPDQVLRDHQAGHRRSILVYSSVLYFVILLLILTRARSRNMEKAIQTAQQETQKILEKKVYERTYDLSKANEKLALEIKERKKSQQVSAEREERIRLLFSSTAEGIYGLDLNGRCTFCNRSCLKLLKYETETDFLGKQMHPLIHYCGRDGNSLPESECLTWKSITTGQPVHSSEEFLWCSDGTNFTAECWAHPIISSDQVIGCVVSFLDISDRKVLEAQLIQAQKMEAIGTLSGGIAHDFNNLLAPIIGYAEMLQEELQENAAHSEALAEILYAAKRGVNLVSQILTFSRQRTEKKSYLNPSPIIKEVLKLVAVGLPPHIRIITAIAPTPPPVLADPTQLHQIIMNLITNAIHAMEIKGGELSISLKIYNQDQINIPSCPQLSPGSYLQLKVADQGEGIAPENLPKIFDPYYSTKPEGKGTGLGLSVVHGIVNASQGHIEVKSEVGKGTIFEVYFPIAEDGSKGSQPIHSDSALPTGHEKVLLIDDWQSILNIEQKRLERLGYNVTATTDPFDALDLFKAAPNSFDMIITDYAMPGLTGTQLADAIHAIKPDQTILLCTGYLDNPAIDQQIQGKFQQIILKPTSKYTLGKYIRSTLDK